MATQLDVYRDWLKIEEKKRPLSYYQLLRLKKFEDDPVRVRANYRQLNAHVRKFASGEFAKESQALLNELAKAMLCLTDARRKAEYDASLGRVETGPGRKYTFEQLLIARKVVDREQLEKARTFAQAVNLEMHDALVQQKLAKPEIVMQVYAESLGLPYVDLAETGVEMDLVPQVPAVLARQHSCVPVMVDEGQLLMASPHVLKPEIEDDLRLRVGMPVRSVLCTAAGINAAIGRFYPKETAAAELAAGPKKAGQATPAPAAAKGAAKQGEAAKAKPTLSAAEQKKQTRMVSFMTFNFGFMATVFFMMLFKKPTPGMFTSLGIGFMVGAVAGGIAFAVLSMRK